MLMSVVLLTSKQMFNVKYSFLYVGKICWCKLWMATMTKCVGAK